MPLLWVHKYQPSSLGELDLHPELTPVLGKLAQQEDVPHLLVYGPSGAGKKTRVSAILNALFGKGAERIKVESRQLEVATGKSEEVTVVSSSFHSEITPAAHGTRDRLVVQTFLKEIAQTQQIDSSKHKFKVVVINEADRLSRDAQAALRRTMEIYTRNVRLIMLANSCSAVLEPIRSRTLLIRVPAPSVESIAGILSRVAEREQLDIKGDSDQLFRQIASQAQRNTRRAILMLEVLHARSQTITASEQVPLSDWEAAIDSIAKDIVRSPSVGMLADVRTRIYELLARCISAQTILLSLLSRLLDRLPQLTPELVEHAARFEHRLHGANKEIFHIEAFVARAMREVECSRMR